MNYQSALYIFNESVPWETAAEGVRRKVMGYNDNLMLALVEFKKGSIGNLHKHFHTQVSYIISGSFEVQLGDEKKIQRAGDVYFIPSDIVHGVVALEDSLLIDVFTPIREDFMQK